MDFKYEDGTLHIARYSFGYGQNWQGKPIYLLRCPCGQPVRAFLPGSPPFDVDEWGFNAHHNDYQAIRYKYQAWAITLKANKCPTCGRHLFHGLTPTEAVEAMVRKFISNYEVSLRPEIIEELLERLTTIESVKLKAVFQHEELAGRPEVVLAIGVFDRYKDEEDDFGNALGMNWLDRDRFKVLSVEVNPFDFTDEVMAEHGEECTCSLCMK